MSGLRCPRCNSSLSRVIETRHFDVFGFHFIGRVRQCRHCNKTYKSKEVIDNDITMPSGKKRASRKKDKDVNPFKTEDT